MPVWHAKAQKLVDAGKLIIVGLVQEQHPDRCRLFLQWQKIGWPMMHDPINLTGQSAVPVFTAIDEYGIVRLKGPDPDTIERDFLDKTYPKPGPMSDVGLAAPPDRNALRAKAERTNSAVDWREYADAEALWGSTEGLESAIDAYRRAISQGPEDAAARFRLGVCYRMRYDSTRRKEGDFQAALNAWQDALDLDPNQYIWRRRIQQYGPRLEKPYPFYDWVEQARADIRARGETPVPLVAEPTGAEIAGPIRAFPQSGEAAEPDARDRITRDPGHYIRVEIAVAPARARPGATIRIHLIFRPEVNRQAHWNNEAEPVRVWVRLPKGWQVDRRLVEVPNPKGAASIETREVDFEARVPETAAQGTVELTAYALYAL